MQDATDFLTEHVPFLSDTVFGNTLLQWISGLFLFLLVSGVLVFVRGRLWRIHENYEKRGREGLFSRAMGVLGRTSAAFLYAVAVFVALSVLALPESVSSVVQALLLFICIFQVALWLSAYSVYAIQSIFLAHGQQDPGSRTTQGVLLFITRLCIWLAGLLVLLENLGVDITALVAGLGVGGIAVALAVQNVLGDLFSSLSIVLDKPFEVGDFIIVDDMLGEVERVGVKTTRVRSLSGEQLVFSNSDLLSSRIRNFKRMQQRRVAFTIGATYQTSREQIIRVTERLKEIFTNRERTRFDRAHFKGFGPSSLDFEIVYYVLSQDYIVYMDIQQELNLSIMQIFEEEGVEFAYPTQTVFLETDETLRDAIARFSLEEATAGGER